MDLGLQGALIIDLGTLFCGFSMDFGLHFDTCFNRRTFSFSLGHHIPSLHRPGGMRVSV